MALEFIAAAAKKSKLVRVQEAALLNRDQPVKIKGKIIEEASEDFVNGKKSNQPGKTGISITGKSLTWDNCKCRVPTSSSKSLCRKFGCACVEARCPKNVMEF